MIATLLMYVWLRSKSLLPFEGVEIKRAALCGVLLSGLGNGLVVWGQQGVPSGIAALLAASIPIFVMAFDCAFFGSRLPGARMGFGMAIALCGVVSIVMHTRTMSGLARPAHIAAISLAVLAWSFGTLLQRHATIASHRVFAFTCIQIFFGALVQLFLATLSGEWRDLDISRVSMTSALATLYLATFASVGLLSAYSWLLTQMSPQKLATYSLVNPVIALVLGALALGEPITLIAALAALSVVVGVAFVLFPSSQSITADDEAMRSD